MEDKLINVLEKEAIRILVDKSIEDNTIYEYSDKLDLHHHIKKYEGYKREYLPILDLTYINIRAEEITKKEK